MKIFFLRLTALYNATEELKTRKILESRLQMHFSMNVICVTKFWWKTLQRELRLETSNKSSVVQVFLSLSLYIKNKFKVRVNCSSQSLYTKSSLPIGLAELWESEPIGTCKNNNPIHDQGCGYNYLDDRPSKWGFPLTLTKTTWIFNFYCTAVFLKAIQLPWTRWFQKCITLGCQIPRSSF